LSVGADDFYFLLSLVNFHKSRHRRVARKSNFDS